MSPQKHNRSFSAWQVVQNASGEYFNGDIGSDSREIRPAPHTYLIDSLPQGIMYCMYYIYSPRQVEVATIKSSIIDIASAHGHFGDKMLAVDLFEFSSFSIK